MSVFGVRKEILDVHTPKTSISASSDFLRAIVKFIIFPEKTLRIIAEVCGNEITFKQNFSVTVSYCHLYWSAKQLENSYVCTIYPITNM